MEPITVTSKLDLATYYKISMRIILKRKSMLIMLGLMLFMACMLIYFGETNTESIMLFLTWLGLFAIILPGITWIRCKANMKKYPVLAEGTVYSITEDSIQNVSPSSTNTSKWNLISKAEETDKAFILYANTYSIHYLPKDGFSDQNDIERLKEMVKANRIKAYFK